MAEKLSIQIALDGGAEIERQLAGIGEAGKKAFADISKSAEQVGGFKNIKPEEVTAKLRQMGVTGADAIGKIQQAVKSARNLETLVRGVESVQTALKAVAIAAPIVGVALVAGFVAASKAAISFAEEINKVSDAAVKLGLSVQVVDQLRGSLEAAGISGKGIDGILEGMGKAADAAALGKVTQAINELKEASTRGFGGQGTEQLKILKEAARGVGPAADAARKALVQLGLVQVDPQGIPIIEGLPKTLTQLIGSTGSAEKGLVAFIEQLRQMGPGEQQSALATQAFGTAAGELVRQLNSGLIPAEQFKQIVTGLISPQAQANAAALEGAINRLEGAWNRFGSVAIAPLLTTQIDAVTGALQSLQNLINSFSWATVTDGVFALGNALKNLTIPGVVSQGLQTIFGNAQQATQAVQQTGQAAAKAGQQSAQGLMPWGEFIASNTAKMEALKQASAQAGQAGAQAGEQGAQGAQQATTAVEQSIGPWERLTTTMGTAAEAALKFASQVLTFKWDAVSAGIAIWDSITSAIGRAFDALLKYIGLRPSAPATGGGAPGKARGGLLGGRGTGTSDSNLAWLSRGEYIMPAWAVRQPGVLAFLEALRRSGRIPGFAEGGVTGGVTGGGGGGGGRGIGEVLREILDGLKAAVDGMNAVMDPLHENLSQVMNSLFAGIGKIESDLGTSMNAVAAKIVKAMEALNGLIQRLGGKASGGLMGGRGTGTSDSNLAWLSRGEYIMPARAVQQPGVLAFLEALRRSGRIPGYAAGGPFIRGEGFLGGGGVADQITNWIAQIASANNQTRIALDDAGRSLIAALNGVGTRLTDALFTVVQDMQKAANELSRAGGRARGGLLGGRGTGTSDSNLAWLSRGEYIVPARAVAQPGMLAFLEALRRSGGNLRAVLDGMGRFALGGMVPRAMMIPAFASGGLAGGSNVTIQFPGLPAIGGLRASSDVVNELQRAAALAQVRSGGRKPSRYS